MVRLLVHHGSALPRVVAWLARVDAGRIDAASGSAREPASVPPLLFHQRAGAVSDAAVCAALRVATATLFADAGAVAGGVLREPDAVFQLQYDDQLALLSNRTACACATQRSVDYALRREEIRQ